jgi:hypothetical protein
MKGIEELKDADKQQGHLDGRDVFEATAFPTT